MNFYRQLSAEKKAGFNFSLLIVFYVFLSVLSSSIAVAIFGEGGFLSVFISTLISPIAILITLIINGREKGAHITIKPSLSGWYFYLLAICLSLGMMLGFGFLNQAVANFLTMLSLKVKGVNLPLYNVWQYLAFVFSICVLPAICEELFFRRMMQSNLFGANKILSYLSIALIFALFHGSLTQFFYQFIYGFVLSVLADKSRCVLPAIFAHFLNNFLVITLSFFNVEIPFFNPLVIVAGLLLLAVFVLVILFVKNNKPTQTNKENKVVKLKNLYLFASFGIFICTLLAVLNSVV